MRGEISPMIAKASTSTQPKLRSKRAEIAEFLPACKFLDAKPLAKPDFGQESAAKWLDAAQCAAAIKRAVWQSPASGETRRSPPIWGDSGDKTLVVGSANGGVSHRRERVPSEAQKDADERPDRLQRAGPTRARVICGSPGRQSRRTALRTL